MSRERQKSHAGGEFGDGRKPMRLVINRYFSGDGTEENDQGNLLPSS